MEQAKYALWLFCLLACGFYFLFPYSENVGSVVRNLRTRNIVERVRRFTLPLVLADNQNQVNFVDKTNFTSFVYSIFGKILFDFADCNPENHVVNRQEPPLQVKTCNFSRTVKIELLEETNNTAMEELNQNIELFCSNVSSASEKSLKTCLDAIYLEIEKFARKASHIPSIHYSLVVNATVPIEETPVMVYKLILARMSPNRRRYNQETILKLGRDPGHHDREPTIIGNRGSKDNDKGSSFYGRNQLENQNKQHNPHQNWNVFSGNKHFGRPIIVSTFPPPFKKTRDARRKSGFINLKNKNNMSINSSNTFNRRQENPLNG